MFSATPAHADLYSINGIKVDETASNAVEAKNKAIDHFKPTKSKRHMVHVHLAEKDGEPVVHVADF